MKCRLKLELQDHMHHIFNLTLTLTPDSQISNMKAYSCFKLTTVHEIPPPAISDNLTLQ
jgi:hypothetical protein